MFSGMQAFGRCGGLVVNVSASWSPILGSKLGPGSPHSVVCRGGKSHYEYLKKLSNKILVPVGLSVKKELNLDLQNNWLLIRH